MMAALAKAQYAAAGGWRSRRANAMPMMPIEISAMPAMTCACGSSRRKIGAEHGDEQWRRAAHQRIGERQVAGPVSLRERQVVAEMDARWRLRRMAMRPASGNGRKAAAISEHTVDPATTVAVSSSGSPPPARLEQRVPAGMKHPGAQDREGDAEGEFYGGGRQRDVLVRPMDHEVGRSLAGRGTVQRNAASSVATKCASGGVAAPSTLARSSHSRTRRRPAQTAAR